jgi:WD40 repeat protein
MSVQIGEPVLSVSAFSDSPSDLAIGCESGKLVIRDLTADREIHSFTLDASIAPVRTSSRLLYAATENHIYFKDLRDPNPPTSLFTAPSEIYDFGLCGPTLVCSTLSDDIILSDNRVLSKGAEGGILPSVCLSLSPVSDNRFLAGYIDTAVGYWELNDAEFQPFTAMGAQIINPPVVFSVAAKNEFAVVGRQTSLSVYKGGTLIADSLFEHEQAVQVVAFAECFGGRVFSVSASADGALMVLNLETLEALDCFAVDNEKVQSITSSTEFIAVADTSDNGQISVFRAQDFEHE